ncbi:hypothetical protein HNQ64_001015 [Prosthecobacter dejongeii]|uniref:Uncharacterized protein n=1 Tax=Prosthecobacter dejongeii TaxID=48465 RepID=A0A7W7YIF6_9BACT|nr:hypothetical protein [Prosthecobacter dejongeii]
MPLTGASRGTTWKSAGPAGMEMGDDFTLIAFSVCAQSSHSKRALVRSIDKGGSSVTADAPQLPEGGQVVIAQRTQF